MHRLVDLVLGQARKTVCLAVGMRPGKAGNERNHEYQGCHARLQGSELDLFNLRKLVEAGLNFSRQAADVPGRQRRCQPRPINPICDLP